MRSIAILLVIAVLAGLSAPVLAQTSGSKGRVVYAKLREVDGKLERAFFNVRTAAELINKSRPGGQHDVTVDEALRFLIEGEQKVGQAITMVRSMKPKTANAAPPSREQFERVERIVGEAVKPIREAGQKIEVALKNRPEDAKKISFFLKQADRNTDAAIKMLRQIMAGL